MHSLVELFGSDRKAVQASRGANASVALAQEHYATSVTEQRDCVVCSHLSSTRVRPAVICQACKVHLCTGKCFALYHKRL